MSPPKPITTLQIILHQLTEEITEETGIEFKAITAHGHTYYQTENHPHSVMNIGILNPTGPTWLSGRVTKTGILVQTAPKHDKESRARAALYSNPSMYGIYDQGPEDHRHADNRSLSPPPGNFTLILEEDFHDPNTIPIIINLFNGTPPTKMV